MCTKCQQQYIIELTVAKGLSLKFKYYEQMIMIVEPILMFSVHPALRNSSPLVPFDFVQRRQITLIRTGLLDRIVARSNSYSPENSANAKNASADFGK